MTVPDGGSQHRSRVHELARMSRTELIIIYQSLCPEHQGQIAVAGWDCDQLIAAIREREDGQVPGTGPAPLISVDVPADSAACQ